LAIQDKMAFPVKSRIKSAGGQGGRKNTESGGKKK
jgi:hypothetical protein